MLPHLTAAVRVSLRATCSAMHVLVDADVAFWPTAGLFESELVAQPLSASQVRATLIRQGQALACMRRGHPQARFIMPTAAHSQQIAGHWSKCTLDGSQFFTLVCQEDSMQSSIAIMDVFNGRLQKVDLPHNGGEITSQWLDERRLLTFCQQQCQVTCITENEVASMWSSTGAGEFLHTPVVASAIPPAILQIIDNDARVQLLSTTDCSTAELPVAEIVDVRWRLREISWSPDHSFLALTFIEADYSDLPGIMDFTNHIASVHRIQRGISICHADYPGFCKALWSADPLESSLALWSSQTGKIVTLQPQSSLHSLSHLATVEIVVSWAYSPDSELLAVCCQAEIEPSEDSDTSSDEPSPERAATCFYQVFCAASSNQICHTSKVLPYDERVLPGFGIDHRLDSFKFDVSRPIWGSSNLCFLPYVEQVLKRGQGIADVPVSCWAQLSPCGGLLVSLPCPLMWRSHPKTPFTLPLEHFHLGSNNQVSILEDQFDQAKNARYGEHWMMVAWLPYPTDAQMYAISGANANLVHLVDGRHDHICGTWHIPFACQVDRNRGLMKCLSVPSDIRLQWSPDGRSLAISARGEQPMIISFDHAASDT